MLAILATFKTDFLPFFGPVSLLTIVFFVHSYECLFALLLRKSLVNCFTVNHSG